MTERKERSRKRRKRVRNRRIAAGGIFAAVCLVLIVLISRSLVKIRAEEAKNAQTALNGSGTGKADRTEDGAAKDDGTADGQEQGALTPEDMSSGETDQKPEEGSTGLTAKVTISAAGDCTLGTDENFDYSTSLPAKYEAAGDPSYFLANVKDIFAGDDLTIVNLEGTLTSGGSRADKTFAFRGDPAYTGILTAGSVEACNLANNHSKDYGTESYENTITNVEEAGIRTFGYDRTVLYETKGVKIGLAGIYELAEGIGCRAQMESAVQSLKEQGADLVIVSFHWGSEKENYPDDTQKELGHAAIDAGADLVLGHHPHVLQGIEKYNGKYIVYSLGNFCFGGNKNPSDKDTMIFQQTFTWNQGTLEMDDQINIIPCYITSDLSYNNYQPTPAQGEEAERILARINEYSSGWS